MGEMTEREAAYVVEQYTFFPRAIVGLLCAARDAAREQGWQELDVELTRNLGEELALRLPESLTLRCSSRGSRPK